MSKLLPHMAFKIQPKPLNPVKLLLEQKRKQIDIHWVSECFPSPRLTAAKAGQGNNLYWGIRVEE